MFEEPDTPLPADRIGASDAHPRVTVASFSRNNIRWTGNRLTSLVVAALLIAILVLGIRLATNGGPGNPSTVTEIPPTETLASTATSAPTNTQIPPTNIATQPTFPRTGLATGQGTLAMVRDVNGLSQVFVLSSDGSQQRMVSDGKHASIWPSLSPDGRRVAFAVNFDGNGYNFDIVVVDLTDGLAHRLTSDRFAEHHPLWSPDGSQIAFDSDRDSSAIGITDIFVMNADGSNARPVLDTVEPRSLNGWSADGKKIYYTSFQNDAGPEKATEVLAAVSIVSGQTRVVRILPQKVRGGTQAAVSPSGQQIAYVKDTKTGSVIMVVENGVEHQISESQGDAFLPVWSPDGKWLAYSNMLLDGTIIPVYVQMAHSLEIHGNPDFQGEITSWIAANGFSP